MNRPRESWENVGRRQMPRRGLLTNGLKLAGVTGLATALSACRGSLEGGLVEPTFTPDTRRSLSVSSILTESVRDPKQPGYNPDMVAIARIIEARRQKAANTFGAAVMSAVAHPDRLSKGMTVTQGNSNDGVYNFGVVDTVSVPGYSRVSIVGVKPAMGNIMGSFIFGVEHGVSDMSYGGSSRLILPQLSTSPNVCNLDFQDLTNWVDRPDVSGWPTEPYPAGQTDNQITLTKKKEWEEGAFKFITESLLVLQPVTSTSGSASPR